MTEPTVYEYAIVRLVPRVEREEYINIGIALYCKKQKYASVKFSINRTKVFALFSEADIEQIENHLKSFELICTGNSLGGPLALLAQDERFRWLTAKRSTLIQCSVVHPGMCVSAEETHQYLFEKLVL